jgi:hypothetical protein
MVQARIELLLPVEVVLAVLIVEAMALVFV